MDYIEENVNSLKREIIFMVKTFPFPLHFLFLKIYHQCVVRTNAFHTFVFDWNVIIKYCIRAEKVLRERFASGVSRGMNDLHISRATHCPISGLIDNAVIEVGCSVMWQIVNRSLFVSTLIIFV